MRNQLHLQAVMAGKYCTHVAAVTCDRVSTHERLIATKGIVGFSLNAPNPMRKSAETLARVSAKER